jgi:hypothetical protein
MDPALLDCVEKLKMANTSPTSLPDQMFKSQVKSFLHKAIDQGNFSAALLILSSVETSVLKVTQEYTNDYLVKAMGSDSVSEVFLLLQLYIDLGRILGLPRSRQDSLNRAFDDAVLVNFATTIGLLIDAGANKNKYKIRCQEDSCEAACYSLDLQSTQSGTLARAVSLGHSATVKVLLLKGVTVNLPLTTSEGFGLNYELEPPLHVAIKCFNDRQLIPLLLDSEADVNCSFRDVRPLGLAIYHSGKSVDDMLISITDERIISRKDILKQLIEKRADVNRRSVIDGIRMTPIQQARKYGLPSIERLLVENGAVERKVTSQRKVRRKKGRSRDDDESDSSTSLRPKVSLFTSTI